jgi:hypothetical protein
MADTPWKELPLHKKIKYFAEIIAILGGLAIVFFYSRELKLLSNQLKFNEAQLKSNEKQLKLNEKQLTLLNESLNLERSKSEARLECRMWRNYFVNIHETITISDSMTATGGKESSTNITSGKDVVKPPPVGKIIDEDRMEVVLMCRNRSPRATAIVDVFIKDDKGGDLSGRGYNSRIKLPIQIEPWGLTQNVFDLEKNDEKRMKSILVRDMEDNECILGPGLKWVKATPGKKMGPK